MQDSCLIAARGGEGEDGERGMRGRGQRKVFIKQPQREDLWEMSNRKDTTADSEGKIASISFVPNGDSDWMDAQSL